MDELIKKFEEKTLRLRILDVSLQNVVRQEQLLAKDCAEECKKVAIKFSNYVSVYIGQRIIGKVEERTTEELFNKFLEEFYK